MGDASHGHLWCIIACITAALIHKTKYDHKQMLAHVQCSSLPKSLTSSAAQVPFTAHRVNMCYLHTTTSMLHRAPLPAHVVKLHYSYTIVSTTVSTQQHCLQAEAEARQVAHALLASHKKEAATAGKKVREQYESKLREKQMQLNAVQNKLQVDSDGLGNYMQTQWQFLRPHGPHPELSIVCHTYMKSRCCGACTHE